MLRAHVRVRKSALVAVLAVPLGVSAAAGACTNSSSESGGTDGGFTFDGNISGIDVAAFDVVIPADVTVPPTDTGPSEDAGAPDAQPDRVAAPSFCNAATAWDSGAPDDAGDAGDADAAPPIDASPQIFGAHMAGCPGAVYWNDRATLCAATCSPCTAAQWVAQRGASAPAFNYWTNDNLGYGGNNSAGEACYAYALDGGAEPCEVDDDIARPRPFTADAGGEDAGDDAGDVPTASPMRVCYSDPATPYDEVTDPLGNTCNWTGCAYLTDLSLLDAGPDAGLDAATFPNDYMGGCDDNLTAGTLCCCP